MVRTNRKAEGEMVSDEANNCTKQRHKSSNPELAHIKQVLTTDRIKVPSGFLCYKKSNSNVLDSQQVTRADVFKVTVSS